MIASLEDRLLKRSQAGNLRELQISSNLIDFSSNDYLGLARSKKMTQCVIEAYNSQENIVNGLGSTGSRLLTGNSTYIQELEDYISSFHGYPTGLLFNCGYMANIGLLSSIANRENIIFFDAQVHASMRDGIRLSRAQAFVFKHNDLDHLENRLKNCSHRQERFICMESLYSTDGSLAPLKEIVQLAEKYNAHLIIDEAHAVGVYGPKGRGLVAQHQLHSRVFAQVITFGKALGICGAIVLGSPVLKQTLINFATSFIYTTALPLHILIAIKCSYDLFPDLEHERQKLYTLIKIFQKTNSASSCTHIQPLYVKGNASAKNLAKKCREHGFDVRALLSPTVQKGQEILRICLHAFNGEEELIALLKHIDLYRSYYA